MRAAELQTVLDTHLVTYGPPGAAMIVNESGTILFANSQASHLFGYVPGDPDGCSV